MVGCIYFSFTVCNLETLEWDHVDISGPPPPARLDHAMCTILLPTPSSSLDTQSAHSFTYKDEPRDPSGCSLDQAKGEEVEKSDSTPSASHLQTPRTVTLISPDSVEKQDFTLVTQSTASNASPDTTLQEDATNTTSSDREIATTSDSIAEKKMESLAATLYETNLSSPDGPKANDSSSETDSINSHSTVKKGSTVGTAECGVPKMVPILFVFGGMDTSGNIHGDSFVFSP